MVGSRVTSSLTMFRSALRLRLIYSPFYKWLRPLRPLEGWVYMNLLTTATLSSSKANRRSEN